MLQEKVGVPLWVGLGTFGNSVGTLTAVSGCLRAAGLCMDGMSDSERLSLLGYWEGCHFSEESDFEMIREQPLFAIEGGSWTSISASGEKQSSWFMLPEDISVDQLSVDFLKQTRVATRLYECLGVIKLPRVEYYRQFVFPRIPEMSDEEVLAHMHDVEMHIGTLRLAEPMFANECASLQWIPDGRGGRMSTEQTYDPKNPVFHEFFPDRLLPKGLLRRADFLRKVGMKTDFNREIFLRCCKELASERDQGADPSMLVKKANALLTYLVQNYFSFQLEDNNFAEFFAEVASYPLVAPRAPRVAEANGCYQSPAVIVPLKDAVSVSSQSVAHTVLTEVVCRSLETTLT